MKKNMEEFDINKINGRKYLMQRIKSPGNTPN